MESSYLDASDLSLLSDLSVAESEDADFTILEEIKSLYKEVDEEYRRYVRSEMLVNCIKSVSEHRDLLPKQLSDKLKRMIINTEVLESVSVKDKNGTKYNMFGLKDEDLLELQGEPLISEEESCVKSAVNTLLKKKCTAFQEKQSKIEKECKMLKCRKPEDSFDKTDEIFKSLNEIAQKMELCDSLLQSISELQKKCVELDTQNDLMMSACANIEAKLQLIDAEARALNSKVVNTVCSENKDFLKAVEILRSTLEKEISNAECELKVLNGKLQEYEMAEKDPEFKNLLKMYNKIRRKHKHLNWCLENMHEK